LRHRRWSTAYVKLNTGSSAAAMVVVHPLDDPPWGAGAMVRLNDGYYSTRRLCRYEGEELHAALDFLLGEEVCVQQGIRMAQIDGQNFDVRVVVIYGRVAATVFRLSPLPMTNLHLGGHRGAPALCRAAILARAWLDALDHCVEAARLYPAAMVGVDLLFERGYLHHHILEMNAFGDFFPGLVDEHGQGVHRLEIEQTAERYRMPTASSSASSRSAGQPPTAPPS
jgi:hypothetical protein